MAMSVTFRNHEEVGGVEPQQVHDVLPEGGHVLRDVKVDSRKDASVVHHHERNLGGSRRHS